jgi:hypothetical protein
LPSTVSVTMATATIDSILDAFENAEFAEYVSYAVDKIKAGDQFEAKVLASIKSYPVSLREFITSPNYLDQGDSIYPKILDELEALNNPPVEGLAHGHRVGSHYTEAVFTGGIGVGKSHAALLTLAYHLYILSCLDSPQSLFDLDSSSEILFVFQTVNATLAKQLDYARFKAMIERSPYFRDKFTYNRDIESELQFPNRIIVRPVTGLESGTIGQNIYAAILDEVNFLEITQNSRKNMGDEYDQAVQLYNSIASRRKSRFMKNGRTLGMLCLVSSKRYPNQFTDRKIAQSKKELQTTGKTSIYVYDKRRWDIKPDDYCGKTFKVFVGDVSRKPRILQSEGTPEATDEMIVDIPIEYRAEFENDIMRALREIAGLSTLSVHPFMPNTDAVSGCFGHHHSILSEEGTDFTQQLHAFSDHIHNPDEKRFVHVDLALTTDSAGVVCGFVSGFKKVKRGEDIAENLPVITVDFALEVRPPQGGEIQISRIREMIYTLRDKMGINIEWVSFDQYQSADSIQVLRQKGFTTGIQSMDRTPVPYEVLKQALYDGRVVAPAHQKLQQELLALEFNVKKNKVDHTSQSSKDISDALAGMVFGLSRRRVTWTRWNVNPIQEARNLTKTILDLKAISNY